MLSLVSYGFKYASINNLDKRVEIASCNYAELKATW